MPNPEEMYQCQGSNCGYIYNPERGCKKGRIDKGVCWDDIPEDYKCPSCGAGKKLFRLMAGPGSTAGEGS
ncbi:MAG: rubredoxin [Desulfarculus sp.]|nr:rubredoxin [Pseudomonadota bacterium]MBV1718193.1 rubredoxin [Desulfarculus sp.]MBU4573632.1 rubredoxin [Pseudomonadota bacterium]MBU4597753.1 rubredoxin [Pseudomonadota bacterium]MBV1737965.1 rubredoxin [Desulfarculus sp.]